MVQWFKPCASTVGGTDSISGPGTKIPQTVFVGQKPRMFPPTILLSFPELTHDSILGFTHN